MLGRSTTKAIYLLQSLMEKYQSKEIDLHIVFNDLEKTYDRVPREILLWALEKRGPYRIYPSYQGYI